MSADVVERLERERDEARSIVRDIHWMAVRYADKRLSYAPGMCNDALRKAYDGGWLTYTPHPQHDLDPQYARQGDVRDPSSRSDVPPPEAAASLGEPVVDEHAARAAFDVWAQTTYSLYEGSPRTYAWLGWYAAWRRATPSVIAAMPVAWRYRWPLSSKPNNWCRWGFSPDRDVAQSLAGMEGEVEPLYASPSPASVNTEMVEATAQFLWKLLDDIDTAGDIAKGDDKSYREMVEKLQRRRFEVGSTDGYTVTFAAAPRPASPGER